MAAIRKERITVELDQEIAVLLIGMRVNRLWKIHKWLPVALGMMRAMREVEEDDACGFLGFEQWVGRTTMMVQYWRSFEHLDTYANDKARDHWDSWVKFNRNVGLRGDVGIWHERYRIRPADYECVYINMPVFGLAKAYAALHPEEESIENPGKDRSEKVESRSYTSS